MTRRRKGFWVVTWALILMAIWSVVRIAPWLRDESEQWAIKSHQEQFAQRYVHLKRIVDGCAAEKSIRWVGRGENDATSYGTVGLSASASLHVATIRQSLMQADALSAQCGRRFDREGAPLTVVDITVSSRGISVSGWASGYVFFVDPNEKSRAVMEDDIRNGALFPLPRGGWFVFQTL